MEGHYYCSSLENTRQPTWNCIIIIIPDYYRRTLLLTVYAYYGKEKKAAAARGRPRPSISLGRSNHEGRNNDIRSNSRGDRN